MVAESDVAPQNNSTPFQETTTRSNMDPAAPPSHTQPGTSSARSSPPGASEPIEGKRSTIPALSNPPPSLHAPSMIPPLSAPSPSLHVQRPPGIPPLQSHGPSLHTQQRPSIPPLGSHGPSLHASIPPLQTHAPSLHTQTAPTIPPLESHAPSLHAPGQTAIPPLATPAPSLHGAALTQLPALDHPPPSLHAQGVISTGTLRTDSPSLDADGEEDDEYERLRRENMSKNASLLVELGLTTSIPTVPTSSTQASSSKSKKKKGPRKEHRDRWGHMIGLPAPGRKQRMACVEIRPDRKVNRAIDSGEYYDSTGLTEGEARRWRFGDGDGGELAEGEAPEVGGVGADFRWKTLDPVTEAAEGFDLVEDTDTEPAAQKPPPAPKVPYSQLPGVACHQCKRKTHRAKMECRNVNPKCTNSFCEPCCKRYSYFVFEEEDRSFICPVCMGMCNCAVCLKKRKLTHLIGDRFGKGNPDRLPGETVQAYIDRMIQQKAPAPFDRVRLVTKADDIQSPPLPEEWQVYIAKQTNPHFVDLRPKRPGRKRRSESAKDVTSQKGSAEGTAEASAERPTEGITEGAAEATAMAAAGDTPAEAPATEGQSSSHPAKKIKLKIKRPPKPKTTTTKAPKATKVPKAPKAPKAIAPKPKPAGPTKTGRPRGRPRKNKPEEPAEDPSLAVLAGGLTVEDLQKLAMECAVAQTGEKVVDSDGETIDNGYSDISPYSGPGAPRWSSMTPPRSQSVSPHSEGSVNGSGAQPVSINDYLAQIQPQPSSTAEATPVMGSIEVFDSSVGGISPAVSGLSPMDHTAGQVVSALTPDQGPAVGGITPMEPSSSQMMASVTPEQLPMEPSEPERVAVIPVATYLQDTSTLQSHQTEPREPAIDRLPEPLPESVERYFSDAPAAAFRSTASRESAIERHEERPQERASQRLPERLPEPLPETVERYFSSSRTASTGFRAASARETVIERLQEPLSQPSLRPSSSNYSGLSQTLTSPLGAQAALGSQQTSPLARAGWGERPSSMSTSTPTQKWGERTKQQPTPPSKSLSFDRMSIFGQSDYHRASTFSPFQMDSYQSSHNDSPTRSHKNSSFVHSHSSSHHHNGSQNLSSSLNHSSSQSHGQNHSLTHPDSSIRSQLHPSSSSSLASSSMYQPHPAFSEYSSRQTVVYEYERRERSPYSQTSHSHHSSQQQPSYTAYEFDNHDSQPYQSQTSHSQHQQSSSHNYSQQSNSHHNQQQSHSSLQSEPHQHQYQHEYYQYQYQSRR